jgi:hypothetical protein
MRRLKSKEAHEQVAGSDRTDHVLSITSSEFHITHCNAFTKMMEHKTLHHMSTTALQKRQIIVSMKCADMVDTAKFNRKPVRTSSR